jgi:ribosome maturation factor RimP
MSTSPVTDAIAALVAPIVSDLKLDLYDLEFNGGLLRVTVDTPPGSGGGVTLDQLSLLTRLVGRDLDHHDPIPGHYTLEVTSPGLERPLRTPAHFHKAIGRTVSIRLHAVAAAERRIQGLLIAADGDTATIRLDDAAKTEQVVPLASIDRARTVFVWGGAEKPGKAAVAKKAGTGSKGAAGEKPPKGPSDEVDASIEEEATI